MWPVLFQPKRNLLVRRLTPWERQAAPTIHPGRGAGKCVVFRSPPRLRGAPLGWGCLHSPLLGSTAMEGG